MQGSSYMQSAVSSRQRFLKTPEELYQAVVDIYAYFLKFVPQEPETIPLEEVEEEEAPQEAEEEELGTG